MPGSSGNCAEAVSADHRQDPSEGLPRLFSVLNWNVEKAKDPDLVSEFAALTKRSDLIFLQEAGATQKSRNSDWAIAV